MIANPRKFCLSKHFIYMRKMQCIDQREQSWTYSLLFWDNCMETYLWDGLDRDCPSLIQTVIANTWGHIHA